MAKLSVVNRNKKRNKAVEKARPSRNELRDIISNINLSNSVREKAKLDMQKRPRDESPCRRRNRCKICGRPRGYNRLTGLCRLHMRTATIFGMVPGMRKASW